jgi:hypothetical protein
MQPAFALLPLGYGDEGLPVRGWTCASFQRLARQTLSAVRRVLGFDTAETAVPLPLIATEAAASLPGGVGHSTFAVALLRLDAANEYQSI